MGSWRSNVCGCAHKIQARQNGEDGHASMVVAAAHMTSGVVLWSFVYPIGEYDFLYQADINWESCGLSQLGASNCVIKTLKKWIYSLQS